MSRFARLFIFWVPFVFVGCATTSTKQKPAEGRQTARMAALEAKLQVQDKKQNKTVTILAESVLLEPSRLRLDLTAGFGTPIGKVVWNGKAMGILVPQQKKGYIGVASEKAFSPVLPVQVHPQMLMRLMLGDSPEGWNCEVVETKEVCRDPQKIYRFEKVIAQAGTPGKWTMESDQFSLTVLTSNFSTKVQIKPETFSFAIPEGYQKLRLP